MRNEYYSHSKVKTWRTCHKLFDYKYEQGLVRKTSPVALLRGTVFHEMLDNRVLGKDPYEPLIGYGKIYDELWEEEKENYPSPGDLKSMYTRYVDRYKDEKLDYRGISEFEITCEYRGIVFKGIIDKLPQDNFGRVWVMDHKTHKVIPDENKRFSDLQTVMYSWCLEQNGTKTNGVLWDYIRTKLPAVPETLVKGGLSRRSNIDTDYDTYMGEIQRLGLNPEDYSDILEKVKKNAFFKRIFLPNPNSTLVTNIVGEFFSTAKEIENSTDKSRNMNHNCSSSCSYFQLCQAEVRGIDSDFIRKQMYTIREEK